MFIFVGKVIRRLIFFVCLCLLNYLVTLSDTSFFGPEKLATGTKGDLGGIRV